MTTLIRNVNHAATDKLRIWLNQAGSGSCVLSPEVTIEAVEGGGLMIRLKQYQDNDSLRRDLAQLRARYKVIDEKLVEAEAELHRRRFLP